MCRLRSTDCKPDIVRYRLLAESHSSGGLLVVERGHLSGRLEAGKDGGFVDGSGYLRRISLRQPTQRTWPESILLVAPPATGLPQASHTFASCESGQELAGLRAGGFGDAWLGTDDPRRDLAVEGLGERSAALVWLACCLFSVAALTYIAVVLWLAWPACS